MKNIKPLFYMLLLCVISGCINPESNYNERVTSMFLHEMKQVDDLQSSFADSSNVFHADAAGSITLDTKAQGVMNVAQRDIQSMNDIKPSDAAKEFHKGVIAYFTRIKNYCATAKQLLDASADKKKDIYTQLMTQYQELNKMPDQLMEVQKNYQEKIGLK
jgi:hypothetical protein